MVIFVHRLCQLAGQDDDRTTLDFWILLPRWAQLQMFMLSTMRQRTAHMTMDSHTWRSDEVRNSFKAHTGKSATDSRSGSHAPLEEGSSGEGDPSSIHQPWSIAHDTNLRCKMQVSRTSIFPGRILQDYALQTSIHRSTDAEAWQKWDAHRPLPGMDGSELWDGSTTSPASSAGSESGWICAAVRL